MALFPQTVLPSGSPDLLVKWRNFLADPANKQGLIRAGLSMMQPVQPGQSVIGHIAAGADTGIRTAEALKDTRFRQNQAADELRSKQEDRFYRREDRQTAAEDRDLDRKLRLEDMKWRQADRAAMAEDRKLGRTLQGQQIELNRQNIESQVDSRAEATALKKAEADARAARDQAKKEYDQAVLDLRRAEAGAKGDNFAANLEIAKRKLDLAERNYQSVDAVRKRKAGDMDPEVKLWQTHVNKFIDPSTLLPGESLPPDIVERARITFKQAYGIDPPTLGNETASLPGLPPGVTMSAVETLAKENGMTVEAVLQQLQAEYAASGGE